MRSGCLSQMASGSQLLAIEGMRTQITNQHCMQSQAEQDETLCAENRMPNACNKVYVLIPVCPFHACQCCFLQTIYASLASDDQQRS